jgi:hypothetical protein
MFDSIKECVLDWNNSYIASNTTTENINDFLEYYGILEQQEAKRKPKNPPSGQYQVATATSQKPESTPPRKSEQTQRNNGQNEESFCSYHQLRGHSDAKCRDPRNPKGVNANNTRRNDWNNNRDHCNMSQARDRQARVN